jgi:signal transduction histidine kinase
VNNRSPIAWTTSQELDSHQWAIAGRRLGVVGRCVQWLLGDWLAYGNSRFGERYARASQITGYDPQTLMNMVYVASRFPISRRRETLSWSHHETLAAMAREEQDRWLDDAAVHHWSVSDLRTMLRASRRKSLVLEASEAGAASGSQREVQGSGADSGCEQQSRLERQSAGRNEEPAQIPGPTLSAAVLTCPRCGERISLFDGRG